MRSEADDERTELARSDIWRIVDADAAGARPQPRRLALGHHGFLASAADRGRDDASDRAGARDRADAARPQPGGRRADPGLDTDRGRPALVHHCELLAYENRHAGRDR